MDKEEALAYQEALDYLYRFVDYSMVRNFRYTPEKFNLGRMENLLTLIGSPHRKYPVVHVAGTKGKGSTSAMIAACVEAAGYKTGFYSSPHLQDFSERFKVNGVNITHPELVELVDFIRPFVDQIENLTWFEITTAIAFEWFARQKVDLGVVEVGLGGRLDSTNVVDPLVAVITSVSMDHMNVLGDTLEKIAFEKAGIIKPGRPVISAPQKDEAREVIRKVAEERGSPLVEVGRDVHFQSCSRSLEMQTFTLWEGSSGSHAEFSTPLLGQHQVENAAAAYAALQILHRQGWRLTDENIRAGLKATRWPGRFEILRSEPLLIIDSAHNRDSARRLRETLDDYLPGRPVLLVFGASDDKDILGMFAELGPRVTEIIATQSVHPRAADTQKLVDLAQQAGLKSRAVLPVENALETALQLQAETENGVILVAGSLFIAAAVRDTWQNSLRSKVGSYER